MINHHKKLLRFIGKKELGFSLIGVIISLSLIGVIAAIASKMSTNNMKAQNRTEERYKLASLMRKIEGSVNCEETLTQNSVDPSTIASGTKVPIDLYVGGATPIKYIDKVGSSLGNFQVLADATSEGIEIRVAKLKQPFSPDPRSKLSASSASFKTDPLTSMAWDWAYSDKVIASEPGTNATVCYQASAGAVGKYQISCAGTGGGGIGECCVVNTMNGLTKCGNKNSSGNSLDLGGSGAGGGWSNY
ncbi:MAG: type II secretion system protein [Bdellovibrionota bacterium]